MVIKIIKSPIKKAELLEIAGKGFGDIVKVAVDVEQEIMAIGGELHADEEAILLQNGSRQENLWGVNIYPNNPEENWIEFDSMINIKPQHGNRSRGIDNPEIKRKILEIAEKLVINE